MNVCFCTLLSSVCGSIRGNFSECCDHFCAVTVFFKGNYFTKNRIWVKWTSLIQYSIDFYCNIVIDFETSLVFSAKFHLLTIFSLMTYDLFSCCCFLWDCGVSLVLDLAFSFASPASV